MMKRSHYSVTEQGATLPLPTHSRLPPHSSSQYAEIQSHHVPAHIPTSFADAIPRNPVSKDQVDQVIHNQQLVQQTQHAQQAQQAQQAQHAQHAQVAGSYQVQHDPYRQPVSGVYTPQSYYTPSPEQHYLPNVQLNYPQYTFPFDAGFQGYPTESDFEDTLQEYIQSLSPKKQDKALIPQARYNNILGVLKDPKLTSIESAQFRFWAKKMFKLDRDKRSGQLIVCHEEKPVAVREMLYRVLVEAHGSCHHGGRDKTSSKVRQSWSWVPKELIARFVKKCPTCVANRSQSSGTADQSQVAASRLPPTTQYPGIPLAASFSHHHGMIHPNGPAHTASMTPPPSHRSSFAAPAPKSVPVNSLTPPLPKQGLAGIMSDPNAYTTQVSALPQFSASMSYVPVTATLQYSTDPIGYSYPATSRAYSSASRR